VSGGRNNLDDAFDGDVVKFAAVLDEFVAAQRAQAIGETRKQRIMWSRTIGGGGNNVSFEAVVDDTAEPAELNALLDKMANAGDRQEARAMLDISMRQLRLDLGTLEREKAGYAKHYQDITEQNMAASQNRRREVTFTKSQTQELERMRTSLREAEAAIEERRLLNDECKRIIAGQSRIEAVEETQRQREAQAAARPAAA
jgi:hypothetical protein